MTKDFLHHLWTLLIPFYLFTVAIETPVLMFGLSEPHSWRRRVANGIWLNAVSYPVVFIALPIMLGLVPRWRYLAIAEVFAPLCECTVFALAFHNAAIGRRARTQDLITITIANLCSFLLGEFCHWMDWF
jgi:hypothetical protein